MRFNATVIFLCGCMWAGCGDPATRPSDPKPLPPPGLHGQVSDANTGRPLAGAVLTIVDGANASMTTSSDAQGNYGFAFLAPGGFTLRARHDGYDSVFQGVTFVGDTRLDIQMRPAMQTLAGTWTGSLAFAASNGVPQTVAIPQLTLMQSGSSLSSAFLTSGPYQGNFSGTLRDPSSIASTTDVTGSLTLTMNLAGRGPLNCSGTTDFTGTVNWTQMTVAAPRVAFDCGTTFTAVMISLVRQQ